MHEDQPRRLDAGVADDPQGDAAVQAPALDPQGNGKAAEEHPDDRVSVRSGRLLDRQDPEQGPGHGGGREEDTGIRVPGAGRFHSRV